MTCGKSPSMGEVMEPVATEDNRSSEDNMSRKDEHLNICLNEPVESREVTTGLEDYHFEYDSLPEIDFADISLETKVFGKTLAAPLMIGAMTGGTPKAGEFNRKLALAAQETGIGLALGSQRPMLKSDDWESYDVKKHAPHLPLVMGNLGAVQLNYGVEVPDIQGLIDKVGCDGFTFHLNPLQEALQPEGDRNFKGLLQKLGEVIPQLDVPVSIKEVGGGISETAALKLRTLPISAIEVAGVGGTSWAYIEAVRNDDPIARMTGIHLKSFGIPTARSLRICRNIFPDKIVIASGGIRTGLDISRALGLGADMAAFALPMLKKADHSVEEIILSIRQIIHELKTVMFVTGCLTTAELTNKIRCMRSRVLPKTRAERR